MPLSRNDFTIGLLILVSIFIPPVAVLCVTGCDAQFWLNIILFLLTWIGAIIHAIWVILYYGHGGRLSWGDRRRLARRRDLTYVPPRPAHVDDTYRAGRNEIAGHTYRASGYDDEAIRGKGREPEPRYV